MMAFYALPMETNQKNDNKWATIKIYINFKINANLGYVHRFQLKLSFH